MRKQLSLEPGERTLAWACDDAERWYVGTDRALHLPEADGYRRLPWELVERADWHRDNNQLGIVEVADWGEPEQRTLVTVAEPGALLELLRERVTKSVVVSVYAPVRGRLGLNVVGRRSPVGSDEVTWSYVLAEGLTPDDPAVLEVAAKAVQQAEAEVAWL